jgi:hypothetical protein
MNTNDVVPPLPIIFCFTLGGLAGPISCHSPASLM